jgi:hypothetical protein
VKAGQGGWSVLNRPDGRNEPGAEESEPDDRSFFCKQSAAIKVFHRFGEKCDTQKIDNRQRLPECAARSPTLELSTRDAKELDLTAMAMLVALCASWGLQQVSIKVATDGVSPLLQAGIRSMGAAVLVGVWVWARRIPPRDRDDFFIFMKRFTSDKRNYEYQKDGPHGSRSLFTKETIDNAETKSNNGRTQEHPKIHKPGLARRWGAWGIYLGCFGSDTGI